MEKRFTITEKLIPTDTLTDEEKRNEYLKKHLKIFIKEMGKLVALALFTVIGFVLSGDILPTKETAMVIIAVIILACVSSIFGIYSFYSNRDIELRKLTLDFHIELARKVDELVRNNNSLEEKNTKLKESLVLLEDTSTALVKVINDIIKAYAPVKSEKDFAESFYKK